jgi:hypothetical protein
MHPHSDPQSHTLADSRRPPEPTSPFGEYTFYHTKPDNETTPNDELAPRRPSLPHIYNELPVPSHSICSRRPRSAGQDAAPEPPYAPTTRQLGSKYLLLNLFRKRVIHLVSAHANHCISTLHQFLPHRHHLLPSMSPFRYQHHLSQSSAISQPHPHLTYHLSKPTLPMNGMQYVQYPPLSIDIICSLKMGLMGEHDRGAGYCASRKSSFPKAVQTSWRREEWRRFPMC